MWLYHWSPYFCAPWSIHRSFSLHTLRLKSSFSSPPAHQFGIWIRCYLREVKSMTKSLVEWKVFLPMAGRLELDDQMGLFLQDHSMILWIITLSASTEMLHQIISSLALIILLFYMLLEKLTWQYFRLLIWEVMRKYIKVTINV